MRAVHGRSSTNRVRSNEATAVPVSADRCLNSRHIAVFVEAQGRLHRRCQHLMRPGDAARIGAAEDRHEMGGLRADVAEAAHDPHGHRDEIPRTEHDLLLALVAPIDRPLAGERHEGFDGQVRMERRTLAGLGADEGDVEILRVAGWPAPSARILGDATADHVVDLRARVPAQGCRRRPRCSPSGP